MTDSVFDVALEKRFTDSGEIALVDVTSADMLLIRNNETGVVMRIAFSTLASATMAALSGSDIISKLGFTPENSANKGNANGYAGLDSGGKVPASQLPSYVDDVLEYANTGAFPTTGETGKIYVALNTNKTYRWSGSAYVEISASPGSTDAVPEGASNLYFTNARASAAAPVQSVAGRTGTITLSKSDVGLSNVNNTADADKPVSTAQQTALDAKANAALEAWQSATLTNGWSNWGGGYETARFFKDNFGIVHLSGLITGGTAGTALFQLPVGYRPSGNLIFPAANANQYTEVTVNSSGSVTVAGGANNTWLSLSGISFRV